MAKMPETCQMRINRVCLHTIRQLKLKDQPDMECCVDILDMKVTVPVFGRDDNKTKSNPRKSLNA